MHTVAIRSRNPRKSVSKNGFLGKKKEHIVIGWTYLMFIDIYLSAEVAQRFLQKLITLRI